jgi:cytochrome c oxidase cbb3-type subunit 3
MIGRLSSVLFVLLGLSLLFTGCGPLPGKPTPADVDIAPDKVTDFAALYQENCAGCHGQDGKGNGALALANPVYLAIASDESIQHTIAQGVHGTQMPPFAQSAGGMVTDAQIDILVKGIRTNWAKADVLKGITPPRYAASSPGNADRGAEVNTIFCASCHGAKGEGTARAGSIVDVSYLALVSDQGLRTTVIAGRPELGHPDWRNCVPNRVMTANEVTDVVAWLASHRSKTPGQPYASNQ